MRVFLLSRYFIGFFIALLFFGNIFGVLGGYAKFSWLDAAMHVAAGLWVAAFILSLVYPLEIFKPLRSNRFVFFIIAAALVALFGLGWEFFEFGTDFIFSNQNSQWKLQNGLADTLSDLFFGLLGGSAGAALIIFDRKSNNLALYFEGDKGV